MKRKFMVSALGALCVLAVGGVFTALAAGGYGSQDDPLVTLSYITDVAVPEANARIDSRVKWIRCVPSWKARSPSFRM